MNFSWPLRDAGDFLDSVTSGRGWDKAKTLLTDKSVHAQLGQGYGDLVRNTEDAREDLKRAKQLLKATLVKEEDAKQEKEEEMEEEE